MFSEIDGQVSDAGLREDSLHLYLLWIQVKGIMSDNTIVEIKKYLSESAPPVSMEEFKDFWDACSEAEKQEFKKTKLK